MPAGSGSRMFCATSPDGLRAFLDEGVVLAVPGPGAGGDFHEIDELPVGDVGAVHAEVIADGGGYVQAGAAVEVRTGRSLPKTYCQ